MDFSTLNWWAVLVAALSTFVLGGLWYSPLLFAKGWMKTNNFTEDDAKKGNPAVTFGVSFLAALVMALNLAVFLNTPDTTLLWGLGAGLLAGCGWVAMALVVIGLFERRRLAWMLINGGYMVLAFGLMGLILGAWR